jgi:hypothetical protein
VNVFALVPDPIQAALWHCDAHVIKMTLETAQLLSTAHHLLGSSAPYRPTHRNHPCAAWARATRGNYERLWALGMELGAEYRARYGRTHASTAVIRALATPPPELPPGPRTPFAQAMPEGFRGPDPVAAYRRYYLTKRGGRLGTWKGGAEPPWWGEP